MRQQTKQKLAKKNSLSLLATCHRRSSASRELEQVGSRVKIRSVFTFAYSFTFFFVKKKISCSTGATTSGTKFPFHKENLGKGEETKDRCC